MKHKIQSYWVGRCCNKFRKIICRCNIGKFLDLYKEVI